jgi:hypothetical protein
LWSRASNQSLPTQTRATGVCSPRELAALGLSAVDETIEKRDQLTDSLERRLAQRTETETLFTIHWAVE